MIYFNKVRGWRFVPIFIEDETKKGKILVYKICLKKEIKWLK